MTIYGLTAPHVVLSPKPTSLHGSAWQGLFRLLMVSLCLLNLVVEWDHPIGRWLWILMLFIFARDLVGFVSASFGYPPPLPIEIDAFGIRTPALSLLDWANVEDVKLDLVNNQYWITMYAKIPVVRVGGRGFVHRLHGFLFDESRQDKGVIIAEHYGIDPIAAYAWLRRVWAAQDPDARMRLIEEGIAPL